jgi:5-methylcytosine-specific restriction endonuclease McrA
MDRRVLEVDHIVPVRLGGTPVIENAQVLCANCHSIKTKTERRAALDRTTNASARRTA